MVIQLCKREWERCRSGFLRLTDDGHDAGVHEIGQNAFRTDHNEISFMIVSPTRKALICGITGQDGSYLTELLIAKGYQVHGIIRRTSTFNTDRLDHIYSDPHEGPVPLQLHFGDLSNAARLRQLIEQIRPDEVYNLGAQSHVRVSFDQAEYTADVVATGALRLLEAFRDYALESGRSPGIIKQVLRRCSGRQLRRRMRIRRFIRAARTP